MNQIATTERSTMASIPISTGPTGSTIAPQSLGEVVRFAEVMCKADIALPKHLRGNAGACMAVAMQAMEWQMSPFAVASKSYAVNGAIAYEAQLIAAVVNTRSGIKGRLKYFFEGEGAELTCRVVGILDGEECEYRSPPIGSITTKNSPLWKSDPQQQLGYFSARSWARRHCPEVILGVYDREEMEQVAGSETARDITPSLQERLAAARAIPHEAAQPREGFDADFVARETAALSAATGGGAEADAEPAETGEPEAETVEQNSTAAEPAPQPVPEDEMSAEDVKWVREVARMLWAGTAKGEQELVENTARGIVADRPPTIGAAARAKATSIKKQCKAVCFGELEYAAGRTMVAALAGMSEDELKQWEAKP